VAETVEQIARRGYAAWNSGDFEQFAEQVHPEIEWHTSGVFPGLRPQYSGHEGLREFWDTWTEPWEKIEIEVDRIIELGPNSVLVLAHFQARGLSGAEVDRVLPNHMVMRDGMLWRFRAFADWDEAVAATGAEI
jgi:ketosteroid isomerase-like protein